MTLRREVLSVSGVTLVALIVGVYAISSTIVMKEFGRLEQEGMKRDVQRALDALANEFDHLAAKAADWAVWDDTYAFIEDGNEKFIESNLGDTAFTDLGLNGAIFVHASGRIVFSKGFNLDEGKPAPLPDEFLKLLTADSRLLKHAGVEDLQTGVVMLPDGPLMIVSRPIVTSERKGPIRGTLIFARYLGDRQQEQLAAVTHLALKVYRLDDPNLPADCREVSASASLRGMASIRALDKHTIAGCCVYNDINGRPALVLHVTGPREIYAQGQETVIELVCMLLAAGIVFGLVTVLLLKRLVLTPLEDLSRGVRAVTESADPSRRLTVTGGDEFSAVGGAINHMLESLQLSQRDLQESQRTLLTLMGNLPGMAYRCRNDRNRTVEFVSDGCVKLTGYSPAELIGNKKISYNELIHPDDREHVWREVQHALWEDRPYRLMYRIRAAGGTERWVGEQGCGVYSPEGDLQALEGFITDITERKHAEDRIRLQSSALEAAANAIVIAGRDGDIVWANAAFTRLTGYSLQEAIGQNPRVLKSGKHDRTFYEQMWKTILDGKPWQGELVNKRKDGSLYTERMTITPVRDQQGEISHFIAIKEDATERERLEEQLFQMQKMETIGRLAGGVAHDFNNILTAISGYNELMLRQLRADSPQRRQAEEIQKAAYRATKLTRQLLAFSRKQVLQPRVLDLSSIVAGIEKMLRQLIGENIALHTICSGDIGRVKADPGQIEQVILNLAINARDAMPRGGVLTLEIANVTLDDDYAARHEGASAGPHVMLAVSDTGCGMSVELQRHLFEPFFTTKPQGKGTGLGLATCYGIIKQSGGHISVSSEPGKGSVFKIHLPRVEEELDTPSPRKTIELPKGHETVLVAEDEPAVRELAVSTLRDLGYSVLEAGNGEEGRRVAEQFAAGKVDLLFTDVVMPYMGGKELADWFRSARPNAKILFTSGYTADAITKHGILQDRVAFLEKPFTPTALARKVREVLDGVN